MYQRGFTLIEILVTIFIMGILFTALFGALQSSLKLIGSNKARTTAMSLLNERLELAGSLAYESVGTTSGTVNGPIPSSEILNLNGVEYTVDTQVVYIDDPSDGTEMYAGYVKANGCVPPAPTSPKTDPYDQNCIITDYKKISVEVSWSMRDVVSSLNATSLVVPESIETDGLGGTLKVLVLDALGKPVDDADVTIVNNTASPVINTTLKTDINGELKIIGVKALSDYEIAATKTGFSTDQTNASDVTNPNPVKPSITIVNYQTSGVTLIIDELANLDVIGVSDMITTFYNDNMVDGGNFDSINNLEFTAGQLQLEYDAGIPGYKSSGTAFYSFSQLYLDSWVRLIFNSTIPAGDEISIQVYYDDETTGQTLVPDTELPGNSSGNTIAAGLQTILITGIDIAKNPITVSMTLTSGDGSTTPAIDRFRIRHDHYPPLAVDVKLTGEKNIGFDAIGERIPKTTFSDTTSATTGLVSFSDIEWDNYEIQYTSPAGYALAAQDVLNNIDLDPDSLQTVMGYFKSVTGSSLLVELLDINGNPIPGVDVTIDQGTPTIVTTDQYGQALLDGLTDVSTDVTITTPTAYSNIVDISGETKLRINL